MIHTVSKAALDVSYRHKRTALGIVADIAAGWNRGAKTYEYDEHAAIDFPCDHTIKVELSVVPFPKGFHSEARRFPQDQQCCGGDYDINYQLRGSLLTVTVRLLSVDDKLNSALAWEKTDTGKVVLEWFQRSIAQHGSTSFEMHLRLVFNPPLHATSEDLRQWRQRYFPDRFPAVPA
jgi:hypothetical protein